MMRAAAGRRAFLVLHLYSALVGIVLLLALERTAVDFTFSTWFFDAAAGAFPLRYDATLEIIGHQLARHLVVMIASCVLALYALSFVLPQLGPWRRLLLFLSLGLTVAPLAVVLLKALSARHCPWSLREFGGYADHLSLFEFAAPGSEPGRCFPGGHASGGFCLLAFYFAGHSLGNRALQYTGLWGGLAAGLGLGLVRIAQGAHFLSHILWSGMVCWLVLIALYAGLEVTSR
jgi:membrane-associated PAP2 superfamily phosphatase